MKASQLIKEDIMPLSLTDYASEALNRMNEYRVSHFPVADNGKFIGVISEEDILNYENLKSELKKETIYYENFYVSKHQYIYDVLKLANGKKLSIIPVVDDNGKYVGSITESDIISFFAKSFSINTPGGVIVLEVNINDYSLTEIANIVESNDAKVLSSYIISDANSTKLEIVIKVSKLNISSLLQTFERYKYQINASFSEEIDYADIKDNYDSLMNYLNV